MEILAYTHIALCHEEFIAHSADLKLLEPLSIPEINQPNIFVLSEVNEKEQSIINIVPLVFESETGSYVPINDSPLEL